MKDFPNRRLFDSERKNVSSRINSEMDVRDGGGPQQIGDREAGAERGSMQPGRCGPCQLDEAVPRWATKVQAGAKPGPITVKEDDKGPATSGVTDGGQSGLSSSGTIG